MQIRWTKKHSTNKDLRFTSKCSTQISRDLRARCQVQTLHPKSPPTRRAVCVCHEMVDPRSLLPSYQGKSAPSPTKSYKLHTDWWNRNTTCEVPTPPMLLIHCPIIICHITWLSTKKNIHPSITPTWSLKYIGASKRGQHLQPSCCITSLMSWKNQISWMYGHTTLAIFLRVSSGHQKVDSLVRQQNHIQLLSWCFMQTLLWFFCNCTHTLCHYVHNVHSCPKKNKTLRII